MPIVPSLGVCSLIMRASSKWCTRSCASVSQGGHPRHLPILCGCQRVLCASCGILLMAAARPCTYNLKWASKPLVWSFKHQCLILECINVVHPLATLHDQACFKRFIRWLFALLCQTAYQATAVLLLSVSISASPLRYNWVSHSFVVQMVHSQKAVFNILGTCVQISFSGICI